MSGQPFSLRWKNAVRDDLRLTGTDVTLAMILATYMDVAGYCFPGVHTIAKGMRVHVSTARRHLRGDYALLPALGYLRITERPGRSSTYQAILPEALTKDTPRTSATPTPRMGATPPPAPVRPELVKELSISNSSENRPDDFKIEDNPFNLGNEGGSSRGPIPDDCIGSLVAQLRGCDSRTEETFRRKFVRLSDHEYIDSLEVLGIARASDDPPRGEAAFVYAHIDKLRGRREAA